MSIAAARLRSLPLTSRLGTALALALAACAHPPPPVPAVAPPPPAAAVTVPEDCAGTTEGTLHEQGGSLWFSAQDAHAQSPLLLGQLAGRFSTVLPSPDGAHLIAVRAGQQGPSGRTGDALVRIDPSQMSATPFWSADGRLRLLGRSADRVVLLAEDMQGTRVAAVDLTGQAVLSEPVAIPADLFGSERPEVPLPHAAPAGPGRWVLRCGSRLCLIDVAAGRVSLRTLPIAAEALWLTPAGLVIGRGRKRCVVPGKKPPEKWARLPARSCPRDAGPPVAPGLSVDGTLVAEATVRLPSCQARGEIVLPSRGGADGAGAAETGAGVVLLPLSSEERQDPAHALALSLIVSGRLLRIGFSGAGAESAPREFRLAIPPGALRVSELKVEGRTLYQVRLRAAVPFDPAPECWRGRLSIRVRSDLSGADAAGDDSKRPDQAFAHRAWAFGRCGEAEPTTK